MAAIVARYQRTDPPRMERTALMAAFASLTPSGVETLVAVAPP